MLRLAATHNILIFTRFQPKYTVASRLVFQERYWRNKLQSTANKTVLHVSYRAVSNKYADHFHVCWSFASQWVMFHVVKESNFDLSVFALAHVTSQKSSYRLFLCWILLSICVWNTRRILK